jgi:hypothetical protein
MASSELVAQILADQQGVGFAPRENIYGQIGGTLASALPQLVSPYASTKSNIATVLGGSLLAGLLGYQARQEAEAQNQVLMPALTGIMGAGTQQEVADIYGQLPSDMQSRLQSTALNRLGAIQERELAQEAAKQKLQQDLLVKAVETGMADPSALGLGIDIPRFPTKEETLRKEEEIKAQVAREQERKKQAYYNTPEGQEELRLEYARKAKLSDGQAKMFNQNILVKNQAEELADLMENFTATELQGLFKLQILPDRYIPNKKDTPEQRAKKEKYAGLAQKYQQLKTAYRYEMFGSQFTGTEQNEFGKLFGEKIQISPDNFRASLRSLGKAARTKARDIVSTATTRPIDLLNQIDNTPAGQPIVLRKPTTERTAATTSAGISKKPVREQFESDQEYFNALHAFLQQYGKR